MSRWIYRLLLFFFLPFYTGQTMAQEIPLAPSELKLPQLTGEKLTVGDVVVLEVNPLNPSDNLENVEPSFANDLKNGPKQVGTGRILWWKLKKADDGKANSIRIGLTSYSTKPFEIPEIVFIKGAKPVFRSQSYSATFEAAPGDRDKDDIYPPIVPAFPKWVWFVAALAGLLFCVGLYWVISWWNKRRKAMLAMTMQTTPPPSPLEEFKQTARKIAEKGYVKKSQFKLHYFAISDSLKRFLGRVFNFDAEESTTRELIGCLQNYKIDQQLTQKWKSIFEEMDIVKFTDQLPLDKEAQTLLDRVTELAIATSGASNREV